MYNDKNNKNKNNVIIILYNDVYLTSCSLDANPLHLCRIGVTFRRVKFLRISQKQCVNHNIVLCTT